MYPACECKGENLYTKVLMIQIQVLIYFSAKQVVGMLFVITHRNSQKSEFKVLFYITFHVNKHKTLHLG